MRNNEPKYEEITLPEIKRLGEEWQKSGGPPSKKVISAFLEIIYELCALSGSIDSEAKKTEVTPENALEFFMLDEMII